MSPWGSDSCSRTAMAPAVIGPGGGVFPPRRCCFHRSPHLLWRGFLGLTKDCCVLMFHQAGRSSRAPGPDLRRLNQLAHPHLAGRSNRANTLNLWLCLLQALSFLGCTTCLEPRAAVSNNEAASTRTAAWCRAPGRDAAHHRGPFASHGDRPRVHPRRRCVPAVKTAQRIGRAPRCGSDHT